MRINCMMIFNEVWAPDLHLRHEYAFYDYFAIGGARVRFLTEF
jgi:hypothetical protein